MKKDLVALRDLGKTNPFNFGTITTAYYLPDATKFDYTYGGNFLVVATGVNCEGVAELRRQVPVGYYLMEILGRAYSGVKFDPEKFQNEFKEFRHLLLTGQIHNLCWGDFDRKILPPIGISFLMYLSALVDPNRHEFIPELLAKIPAEFNPREELAIPAI